MDEAATFRQRGPLQVDEKDLEQLNGRYVLVEGVFDREGSGHMGVYPGELKSIHRLELWDDQ